MKLIRILFKRETAVPMAAVTFASAVCVALVCARIFWVGHLHHAFLVWNLFLAWLPLIFALLAAHKMETQPDSRWHLAALCGAWLLFFPNSHYIFTDLIHLTSKFYGQFWVDLTLILACALTGLVLGFLSLYLMQGMVARRYGGIAGWLFVAASAGLASLGVYIGRFLRFNSWDVILRPGRMYQKLDTWMEGPMANWSSFAFLVLFATFLFIAYVMLYALTHMSPALSGARATAREMTAA